MNRRDFIVLLSGAAVAVGPMGASAQQRMPVIGFLSLGSEQDFSARVAAFHEGLKQRGYVPGHNVTVDYKWAGDRVDSLPKLAADLVGTMPNAIAVTSIAAAIAVKNATSNIPVVFFIGGDPIELGLVSNLSHPGANLTGISNLAGETATKRLEFLHQIIPTASKLGVLADRSAADSPILLKEYEAAAKKLGISLHVLEAGTEPEIKAALSEFQKSGVAGVAMLGGLFFTSRSTLLAQLSNDYSLPSSFQFREFASAGGLLSYGGSFTNMYRDVGTYVGRILQGEDPGDLPVQQGSKAELIVNLRTANRLGLDIPLSILARADEVIE